MKRQAILPLIALALGTVVWFAPWPLVRYGFSFPLLWVLPGLSWALFIPHQALNRAERFAVGLGLNFTITPLVTLLLVYLPGSLTRVSILAVIEGIIVLPTIISVLTYPKGARAAAVEATRVGGGSGFSTSALLSARLRSLWRDGWLWLPIALLIAAGLRVVNLNYAEFEGDEARVMMRAAEAIEGDETIIFQHDKGPSQLTVVMPGWRLTGMTNEWMSRLPFSWASILGVAAVFLHVRLLEHKHAGGIAACLLATEGFLVGLGRGMRHHSLVFALTTLGLLCLLAYYKRGRSVLVIVGAILFVGAALAHYDAVLALPVGLFLIGARLWRDRRRILRAAVPVVAAGLVGTVLTGLFYLPFWRNPHMGATSHYLSSRIGGHVYNNLQSTFELSAIYNSIYFLAALALALAGRMMVAWSRWGRVGLAGCGVLLVAVASGFVWPEHWVAKDTTLAWVPSALLLLGALLSPRQSTGIRALWLWLGIPVMFFLFFVALPLTHVYTIFLPGVALAAIGLEDVGGWLAKRSKAALYAIVLAGVVVYALCGNYAIMVFVDHTPEYLRNFPESQASIYRTPYEQMPIEVGLYGFPYRVGWKAVGYLIDEGQLAASYDSNEKPRATAYYTRRSVRLSCASPDVYFVATDVYDQTPLRWDQIEAEYQPAMIVTVGGQPKLTVYRRDAAGFPSVYRAEEYGRLFDRGSTPERVASSAFDQVASAPPGYVSHEVFIGDFAKLMGYKIDTRHATPGGYVELTLLWEALGPATVDYQVFTHLHDGEMMRGQLDGQPVCDNHPTSRWQPGQFVVDPRRIPIKEDAPPGSVPLTVGMYDLATMQRAPVSSPDGAPAGDNVYLTDVVIQAP